jgi:hypothetical protein
MDTELADHDDDDQNRGKRSRRRRESDGEEREKSNGVERTTENKSWEDENREKKEKRGQAKKYRSAAIVEQHEMEGVHFLPLQLCQNRNCEWGKKRTEVIFSVRRAKRPSVQASKRPLGLAAWARYARP